MREFLHLEENGFTGPLPNMGNLSKLKELFVGVNQWENVLPDGLDQLRYLSEFLFQS